MGFLNSCCHSINIFGVKRLKMRDVPGSLLHAHVKKCKGGKDERWGLVKISTCGQKRSLHSASYAQRKRGLVCAQHLPSCGNIYQALPFLHLSTLHFFVCACRGAPGKEARRDVLYCQYDMCSDQM